MIYAVYKGEKLIASGKSYEVCNKLGIDTKTLYNYCTPSRHKRQMGGGTRTLGYRIKEDDE
jgi:hypothetical protein